MLTKSFAKSCFTLAILSALAMAATMLSGCSGRGGMRPTNSIREPVLHNSDYTTLGLGFGRVLALGDAVGNIEPGSIYANRFFSWDVPVSAWSEYNLLPVHWNFLLTGEQYADSVNLRTQKLHASVFGGISGFFYSQREDWSFPADIGVKAKYLLSDDEFVVSQAGINCFHFLAPEVNTPYFSVGYGWQLTEGNSVELDYQLIYFNFPDNAYSTDILYFRGGDTFTELVLHHHFYFEGRHVIGPEIGWGLKNQEFGGEDFYKAGLNYRYVFR